jgi:mRNA interferase HigB
MRIVARGTLVKFWTAHADAKRPLEAWFQVCRKAEWATTREIKTAFGANVDFLPNNRAVFDIGGNKYRLVVVALLRRKAFYIRFVGTHAEYDKIDAKTI